MALCMLFSSYVIVNIQGDIIEESRDELDRINSLIKSLKTNECFEKEQDLIDQLPSLIWISRETEGVSQAQTSTWSSLETVLKSSFSTGGKNSLTTLAYIQNKDY